MAKSKNVQVNFQCPDRLLKKYQGRVGKGNTSESFREHMRSVVSGDGQQVTKEDK